jgi:hypothetical protein
MFGCDSRAIAGGQASVAHRAWLRSLSGMYAGDRT